MWTGPGGTVLKGACIVSFSMHLSVDSFEYPPSLEDTHPRLLWNVFKGALLLNRFVLRGSVPFLLLFF